VWRRLVLVGAGLAGVLSGTPRPAPAAWAAHGMVASEHRLASQAGVEMLRRGGNAIDAAVAAAFAVCVVNPSSCGIGGGGFMLLYVAKEQRALALDFRETAPAAATADMFVRDGRAVPELSRRGGLAVAVPGEVAGLTLVSRRYGKLPLAVVLEPAIRYARDGFPIEAHLAEEIARLADVIRREPGLARNFLRADGTPHQVGDLLRQPELARTLQRIAKDGAAAFYRGEVAAAVVRTVQTAGGVLAEADLRAYRPRWRQPLHLAYNGYDVITFPPPSSGGTILEVLGMLRHDDLRQVDTVASAHLLVEAMKHAFADRAEFYGDPDFAQVPLSHLLSPANLATLRRRIRPAATLPRSAYGSAPEHATAAAPDAGTSHLSVMDDHGNAVACTSTINTAFGSLLVAGETGIILNNEMDDFVAQPGTPNVYGLVGGTANAIAPHKRPLSSMSPTIVTARGRPVLAVGASGGPFIISGTLQVLLDVLALGLDARMAVAAPRMHDQWMPPVLAVEPDLAASTRTALAARGHNVKEVPAMGAVQIVRKQAGVFEGASDPRKGGEAVGW
jgi:gamma-glutamyltranspeptidase/glutathione hydrolase